MGYNDALICDQLILTLSVSKKKNYFYFSPPFFFKFVLLSVASKQFICSRIK